MPKKHHEKNRRSIDRSPNRSTAVPIARPLYRSAALPNDIFIYSSLYRSAALLNSIFIYSSLYRSAALPNDIFIYSSLYRSTDLPIDSSHNFSRSIGRAKIGFCVIPGCPLGLRGPQQGFAALQKGCWKTSFFETLPPQLSRSYHRCHHIARQWPVAVMWKKKSPKERTRQCSYV